MHQHSRIERFASQALHTSDLEQYNDPSHVRDGLFIELSTATVFVQIAVVRKGNVPTHNTPEMRNQYFSGVIPLLEHGSSNEVDVDVVTLKS